jgi:hypothetical protein
MQQVNLYQPVFKKQEKVFSAKTLLEAALAVFVAMMLFYAYGRVQVHAIQAEVENLESQRTQRQERLQAVVRQFPAPERDPQMVRRLEQLRTELASKEAIVEVLGRRDMGNRKGFSGQLEALARQRPKQLWLRKVTIDSGGADIGLEGSAYVAEQVPQFLQALSVEQALEGVEFRSFLLQRAEEAPRRVDFTVSTLSPVAEEKGR